MSLVHIQNEIVAKMLNRNVLSNACPNFETVSTKLSTIQSKKSSTILFSNLLLSCSFAKSKSSFSTKCALTWERAALKIDSGRTSSAFGADVSRMYGFSNAVLLPTNVSFVSRPWRPLLFESLHKVESSTIVSFDKDCFSLCSTNRCCYKIKSKTSKFLFTVVGK